MLSTSFIIYFFFKTSSQDLDRFEMASQGFFNIARALTLRVNLYFIALEYERNHGAKDLQPFYDSSIPNVRHPQVRQWSQDLMVEREELQTKK